MRRKSVFTTHDLGDGFCITAQKHPNWTEYEAAQLDEPGGYIVGGRVFRSCYRREADAKIEEWKAQDAATAAQQQG